MYITLIVEHKLNASRNEASKFLNFCYYLTHKIMMYVSLKEFLKIKHVHSCLGSQQWQAVSKLIRHCCALTPMADICHE